MTTGTCYMIYCGTGCTCCNSENHYRGPFSTREIAEEKCKDYTATKLLASQYAENGRYTIMPTAYEQLPDGRLILDGSRITSGFADDGDDWFGYDL